MRKNLALTAWLLLPILVFAGLVVWIFITMDRPRLMDEAAVGPGSADTGGANALGEWLAGRSPNEVERANIARRQGQDVDPFWWPGGVEVIVRAPQSGTVVGVSLGWIDPETDLLRAVVLRRGDEPGVWSATLRENRPPEGSQVYLSDRGMRQRIRDGRREVIDDTGVMLVPFTVRPVPSADTLPSDPIGLELLPPG